MMQNSPTQATPKAVQLSPLKLPQSEEDWLESDRALARSVVPAVVATSTVDAKHEALCQGIYHHFSSQYGCATACKPRRKRRHARRLKKITAEKNEARKQLRHAKTSNCNRVVVQELAQKISTNEIMHTIKYARSRSSASPLDGISYKILKKCPSLIPALSNLYNLCWTSASVPQAGDCSSDTQEFSLSLS